MELEVKVEGRDPVTGEPIARNVNLDDVGPDRTDPFLPPPCAANSNTACLGPGKRFKVTTEFDGKPGVKLASGQKNSDTWDAIFGGQGSSSGDVYLDIIDRCQTNGYFRTDVNVSTDDEVGIIFYDEETGVWRKLTHPKGSPPSQTTVSKALPCSTTPKASPTPTPTVSTSPTPGPTNSIRRGR
jgi:hypothetical protein